MGQTATLTLNKGMTSSGGSVAINGGSAEPLRANVQGISVTSERPVWEPGDGFFANGFEAP
jgi:hypothetical protein